MDPMNSDSDSCNALGYDDPLLDSISIPDYVKNYVPRENELNTVTKSGHQIRFIFSNVQFTNFELEHIRAFKVFAIQKLEGPQLDTNLALESFKRRFGGTAFADDGYLLRCLIGNNYRYQAALDDMKENLQWRKSTLPIRRHEVEGVLSRGIIYVHGRDRCMRPVVVLQLSNVGKCSHELVLRCIFFMLELTIRKLMIPGRIEQWRVIVDMNGTNLLGMQVTLIKQIARALTVNYRGRLSQMFLINAPYIISGLWGLVKNVLPEVTQEKIQISSGKNTKKLLENMDASQLEKKFGGTAANVSVYDIPVMPEM
ncbi:CRAL-TRIO domain-containing protein C3H8.02 [Babesia sp. Xinjiang]|uniref:CRAL-TRIO domain-containing protein C3H8.02 n=1 Tax=Babesia sp. Xinjiang TaxID=462227 RepID=UPI000A2319B4|nr:CRAL-TRIO domain-containing protein C3H8.02 [Babesia sp. Xinjiang]ORM40628.1 CRAL-TRIO domain-containing protein C3H8.02 [Babesia sp. Xinjiang]